MVQYMDSAKMYIRIMARGRVIEILADDIRYIESREHNCMIHMGKELIETGASMTLTALESLLPSSLFMRCHNSYIVNLSHVESVDKAFVLKSGEKVPISRANVAKCKRRAYEFHGWGHDDKNV